MKQLKGLNVGYFSPSYLRSGDKSLTQHIYPFVKMAVHKFEAKKYEAAGLEVVVIPDKLRGNIANVRNWILEEFLPQYDCVVMMDDDISYVGRWDTQERYKFTPDELEEFCEKHTILCKDGGLYLWGVNCQPTDKGAYREYTPYSFLNFISGSFSAHMQGSDLRYDTKLPLKEDFDMTLQHLHRYGGCMRANFAFFDAKQSEQAGGCAEYRNLDVEKEQFYALQRKWGSDIIKLDTKSRMSFDYNPKMQIPIRGV